MALPLEGGGIKIITKKKLRRSSAELYEFSGLFKIKLNYGLITLTKFDELL